MFSLFGDLDLGDVETSRVSYDEKFWQLLKTVNGTNKVADGGIGNIVILARKEVNSP